MKFFVSGGGTGGHFFPALALIECMLERGLNVEFVGSLRGIEYRFKDSIPCKAHFLKSHPFIGKGPLEKAKAVYYALTEGLKLLRHTSHVKGVVFGGYASLPLGFALSLRRKGLYLHEQNSVPSTTNMLLSKFSEKVFITFEHSKRFFPEDKVIKTGLPVRKRLLQNFIKEDIKESFGFDKDKPVLLVMGGSQGASFLNQLATEIFSSLPLQGIHITGERDKDKVESFYKERKLPVKVFAFSEDMSHIYGASDLAISRAGASSITELSLFGIPSLFIPFPFSARDHQFYNAKEIEDLGGGLVIKQEDATLQRVINGIELMLSQKDNFSRNIKRFANPYACQDILRLLVA